MNKPKILFICVHNSARSQMAEAFLNDICGAEFEAQSAGLEPGTLNPLVVEVMREAGLDISKKQDAGRLRCFQVGPAFHLRHHRLQRGGGGWLPIFPGPTQRLHWPFPDPSKVEGTPEEKLEKIRQIRDAIQARIEQFCAENCTRPTELGRSLRRPQSSGQPGSG